MVTSGQSTIIGNSPTGPGLRRPCTFSFVVGALKRNSGESLLEKVKEPWGKIRALVRKDLSDEWPIYQYTAVNQPETVLTVKGG